MFKIIIIINNSNNYFFIASYDVKAISTFHCNRDRLGKLIKQLKSNNYIIG